MKKAIIILLTAITFITQLASCDTENSERDWIPPQGFQPDTKKGEQLFIKHCSVCHGNKAKGSTQGPPLIHKYYEPSHHADMAFYMAAKNGVKAHHWSFGDMPSLPQVKGDTMGHIVAYVRQEQRRAGIQ